MVPERVQLLVPDRASEVGPEIVSPVLFDGLGSRSPEDGVRSIPTVDIWLDKVESGIVCEGEGEGGWFTMMSGGQVE